MQARSRQQRHAAAVASSRQAATTAGEGRRARTRSGRSMMIRPATLQRMSGRRATPLARCRWSGTRMRSTLGEAGELEGASMHAC